LAVTVPQMANVLLEIVIPLPQHLQILASPTALEFQGSVTLVNAQTQTNVSQDTVTPPPTPVSLPVLQLKALAPT
jgi:hypothetical protein